MNTEHLTTAQAAERAQVSRPTVSRALKWGELQAIRDNAGRWLIDPKAVDAWAEKRASVHSVQGAQRSHSVHEPEKSPDYERLNALSRELAEAREALARSEGENTANRERIIDLKSERDRLLSLLEAKPVIVRGFWSRLFNRD